MPTPGPIYLPSPGAQESTTYYVFNCSGVNVRACADTSCEVVVSLPFRSALPVIGEAQGEEINGDACWKEICVRGGIRLHPLLPYSCSKRN